LDFDELIIVQFHFKEHVQLGKRTEVDIRDLFSDQV